jgi:hypothetical protein
MVEKYITGTESTPAEHAKGTASPGIGTVGVLCNMVLDNRNALTLSAGTCGQVWEGEPVGDQTPEWNVEVLGMSREAGKYLLALPLNYKIDE